MISHQEIPWKNQVGVSLLRSVFALYCLIAIIVTVASLSIEYRKTEDQILHQLQGLEHTFSDPLVSALWEIDKEYISTVLNSMARNLHVSGIALLEPGGRVIGRVGQIPESEINRELFNFFGDVHALPDHSRIGPESLIPYHFSLYAQSDNALLGTVTLFWDRQTIHAEVAHGFTVLIIGALVKTAALWIIFTLLARSMLNRPFTIFTHAIRRMDEEHPDKTSIELTSSRYNEFSLLRDCFNSMVGKMRRFHAAMENRQKELEEEITRRLNAELALENHKNRLEGVVQERTQALLDSNERLSCSVMEKETLLQELNHRVKNNLQVIASLLNLQKQELECSEAFETLQTAQKRIHAIASVHDLLIESQQCDGIRIFPLFSALIDKMELSYGLGQRGIHILLEGEDRITLSTRQATSLGLALHELLTNAIKHGFKKSETGFVRCSIDTSLSHRCEISVEDSGNGFSEGWNAKKGMGIRLVKSMIKDGLKGELSLPNPNEGSTVKISWTNKKECSPPRVNTPQ
ncbi:MAG: ATP-binding protein [Magnetococcales bacterium]|nr:ATP-binding protein [Magnetococcales bacterium]